MTRIIHVVLWKLAPPPAGVDALVHKQQVTSGFAKLLKVGPTLPPLSLLGLHLLPEAMQLEWM